MILLDTHVVVWWLAGQQRLSSRAKDELDTRDVLLVSPITCWEVATLVDKGRLALDQDVEQWSRLLYASNRVEPAPLSSRAATRAGLLGRDRFHADPADRLLYATAWDLRVSLLTKDTRIHDFAARHEDVAAVW